MNNVWVIQLNDAQTDPVLGVMPTEEAAREWCKKDAEKVINSDVDHIFSHSETIWKDGSVNLWFFGRQFKIYYRLYSFRVEGALVC